MLHLHHHYTQIRRWRYLQQSILHLIQPLYHRSFRFRLHHHLLHRTALLLQTSWREINGWHASIASACWCGCTRALWWSIAPSNFLQLPQLKCFLFFLKHKKLFILNLFKIFTILQQSYINFLIKGHFIFYNFFLIES